MRKICLVAPFVPPYGGMALQAGKLVESLRRRGIPVFSVRVNRLPTDVGFWYRAPGVRTAATTVRLLRNLSARLKESDVVVIFSSFFNYFFWVTYPVVLLANAYGKSVILNARGGGAGEFCRRYRPLLRPLMRKVDLVIAPSGFLAEVFQKEFRMDVGIVRTMVDTQQFPFRHRRPLRPRLLAARNLETIYGVDVILKALKIVRERYPEAVLTIAGNGSQSAALKALAKDLGLEPGVEFLGSVAHDDMPAVYDRHDIFINASRVDNLPNALLEAFASGLPVVSTAAGGIPFLVEHGRTGLLVEVDNHEKLAEAVVFLLTCPEEASRLAGNARLVAEEYGEERVVASFLDMVERAFQKRMQRNGNKACHEE